MADVAEQPPATHLPDPDVTEALVERLFRATIDSLEIASVHVGSKLGYYRAPRRRRRLEPRGARGRTGTTERYTREWLERPVSAAWSNEPRSG